MFYSEKLSFSTAVILAHTVLFYTDADSYQIPPYRSPAMVTYKMGLAEEREEAASAFVF